MPRGRSVEALLAPALGAGTGFVFFVLLCLWFGRPLIPTAGATHVDPMANIQRPQLASAAAEGPKGVYETICKTCHQADGKGMPGAFPPLAGSEWVTGDVETPIRIVLLGLGGPIQVAGQSFNAVMPPPAGLSDAQIAEAVTHIRVNFGNKASECTEEKVAEVRASLAGRTTSWTAAELDALRVAEPSPEAPAADGGAAPAEAPAEDAPAEAAPAEPAAPAPTPAAAPAKPPAAPKGVKAP